MDVGRVEFLVGRLRQGTATDKERDEWSLLTAIRCPEVSLTDQSMKEDADINVILKRFGITGELPQNYRPPIEADFVDVFDYQSARNALIEADRRFMEMPAELRARFDNDPQKVVDFLLEPKNLDEAIRLGLAPPKPVPPIAPVAVTPPA